MIWFGDIFLSMENDPSWFSTWFQFAKYLHVLLLCVNAVNVLRYMYVNWSLHLHFSALWISRWNIRDVKGYVAPCVRIIYIYIYIKFRFILILIQFILILILILIQFTYIYIYCIMCYMDTCHRMSASININSALKQNAHPEPMHVTKMYSIMRLQC